MKSLPEINYLLLLATLLSSMCVIGQPAGLREYEGVVVDEQGSPIPFAHIRVLDSRFGTIGNSEAAFKMVLPDSIESPRLKLSAVGYQSLVTRAKPGKHTYRLEEDVIQLQSVVVVPVDYARQLIQAARNRIEVNYPQQNEQLTGFYRERLYWDDNRNDPIYIIEMVTEVEKESYEKEAGDGNVRLVQGRSYESHQIDTLTTRFYAGPHIPHRADVVARRHSFLSGSSSYRYDLVDTLRFEGQDLFEITFSKSDNPLGTVWIQDSTFAVVKVEMQYTKFFDPLDRDRIYAKYKTEYETSDDHKWRLKKVTYSSAFDRKKGRLTIHDEFIRTSFRPVDETIPYIERLQYRDIALDKTGAYDSTYWDNYTVALPDPSTQKLFNSAEDDSQSMSSNDEVEPFALKLLGFLRRLEGSYSLHFTPVEFSAHEVNYVGQNFILDKGVSSVNVGSWSLASELNYRISDKFLVGYRVTGGISEHYVSDYSLRFQYQLNLNPKGRPILLAPMVSTGLWSTRYLLDEVDLSDGETINSRKLDASSTAVYSETRHLHFTPELRLQVEKSRLLSIYAGLLYPFAISSQQGITFQEQSGFFIGRKTAFVSNDQTNASTSTLAASQTMSYSLGLLLHF